MKTIILLLTIIYFIGCESCGSSSPAKLKDCYSIKIEGKKCCFVEQRFKLKGNDVQIKHCDEFYENMNKNKLEENIKNDLPAHATDFKLFVICNKNEEYSYTPLSAPKHTFSSSNNSSYLKIGFLLIFCLLF